MGNGIGVITKCPVWKETSVHGTCAVHRVLGFYCFLLFPIVSRCTSAVHRNLTFYTGEMLTTMLGSMNITANTKTIMFLQRILCTCKDLPG